MDYGTERKLDELVSGNYNFNLGNYISEAWRLLSANAGTFIIFSLIAGVTVAVLGVIPIIGQLASSLIISPALLAGFYYLAHEADVEGSTELGTGFRAFDNLSKLLPVFILTILVTLAGLIPFLLVGGLSIGSWFLDVQADPMNFDVDSFPALGSMSMLLLFLLLLVPLYLIISYSFAVPLVIFKDLPAWEAMETSRKIVSKKWFYFFGLLFVGGFIAGLGVILLFIGIFFTYAMTTLPMYAAYKDIIGFETDEEDDELAHLID